MTEQTKPPVLSIKMVPAGVDLVIAGLTKLPYEQVADLIAEIRGQALFQMEELQKAAQPDDAEASN
tara:strand:- start:233 stop:430 length:198 start_codon:yes stop_codon:yes gene_type:complete